MRNTIHNCVCCKYMSVTAERAGINDGAGVELGYCYPDGSVPAKFREEGLDGLWGNQGNTSQGLCSPKGHSIGLVGDCAENEYGRSSD